MSDTIFALATAPGKAGLSVIRISGPDAFSVSQALGGGEGPLRLARLRTLVDGDGSTLDQAIVLTFGHGASFTGEDVVELHLHGSIAVQRAVMRRLTELDIARPATAGEFTKRALLNGRMDLTQVQGLADVIDAETEEQRRAAMRVMDGEMSALVLEWRRRLVRAAALLEATIDFADEEVPVDVMPEVRDLISPVIAEMRHEIDGVDAARSLREGFSVAIVGEPNAGKSSLLNAIVRGDPALVSDIPGTTRDVIEQAIDLDGLRVVFADTAGLRETSDPVERLGVERALQRATDADLRIFLHEGAQVPDLSVHCMPGDLVYRSKSDQHGAAGISAMTGEGIADLLAAVSERLTSLVGVAGFVSRESDRTALATASDILDRILQQIGTHDVELVVSDIRMAITGLERIIGQIGVEDVLDEVFRSFCLGK
ncbi:tRNA uridine-5-carboxymethylaminomethyl(34) synthesis GTPase MnmE [Jannaschia sp.]|nr:tRNA uridine-5-carboxymethylaminomethyl(34) synthesis GTPase MnmE [Jannaschia sp.]